MLRPIWRRGGKTLPENDFIVNYSAVNYAGAIKYLADNDDAAISPARINCARRPPDNGSKKRIKMKAAHAASYNNSCISASIRRTSA